MIGLLDIGTLSLQVAIAGALLEGVRRRNPAAAVNAAVALAVALLPILAFGGVVGLGSPLSLWIGVAGLLHCLGMLGGYESVPWWDHVTHTVSAALVAALLYAALLATDRGPVATAGATVLLTVAVGALWELVELVARDVGERFDVEPVLVHYGWRDTAFDLGFDLLGAVVVVVLEIRLFVPVVSAVPGLTEAILVWSVGLVIGGSFLLVLVLAVLAV
jgi:hypothetical protein